MTVLPAILASTLLAAAAPGPGTRVGPPSARAVLDAAVAKAGVGKKGILVGFRASWCGYCRKLEQTLTSPGVRPALDRRFVVVWLDVLETGEKVALENPGGRELFNDWSGGDAGIPFLATLDFGGRLVATSLRAGPGGVLQSIGFPSREPEVRHLLSMLRSASPSMTDEEARRISEGFLGPR